MRRVWLFEKPGTSYQETLSVYSKKAVIFDLKEMGGEMDFLAGRFK